AGRAYRTAVEAPRGAPSEVEGSCPAPPGSCQVTAPLPGLLVDVRVAEGEQIEAGAVVAVLESMKMHLELRAPRGGIVRSLPVRPGQEVAGGEILAVIG
ncbi:MAG: acetyl-CoA carboxylase biotin carboxyl carrier protein subunit, partial [Anaerolineae bacterium]